MARDEADLAQDLRVHVDLLLHVQVLHERAHVVGAQRQADDAKVLADVHRLPDQALGGQHPALLGRERHARRRHLRRRVLRQQAVEHAQLRRPERLARPRHLDVQDRVILLEQLNRRVVLLDLRRHTLAPLRHHAARRLAVAARREVRLHLLQRRQPPQRQPLVLQLRQLRAEGRQRLGEVVAGEVVLHHVGHPRVGGGHRLQPLHDGRGDEQRAAEGRPAPRLGAGDGDERVLAQQVRDLLARVAPLARVHHHEGGGVRRLAPGPLREGLALVGLGAQHGVHDDGLRSGSAARHRLSDGG
mmetsp:Transcript_11534/g.24124  ORF Transcript_11534/g.24124 Transcript_11534/m.24124 type:complete len:301 (+) Transcript_11534:618-1520(+)